MHRNQLVTFVFIALALASAADARPARPAPPLPAPAGRVITVNTEAALQTAVRGLTSDTTILIAPGRYALTSTLYVHGPLKNVAIRGGTDNADDVVLVGRGMLQTSYGPVPFGVWTGDGVDGITIANLTIRDLYFHPIILNGGTQRPHIYNVHLVDAGEQFIKSNPDAAALGARNGILEYSIIEFTTTARNTYPKGIDIHGGSDWTIRHNLFRNIVGPAGAMAGPAVLAWRNTSNTVTDGNTFINCSRGIAYGADDKVSPSHSGGIIRNNFIVRGASQPGDVGIILSDSADTQILNNTVMLSGTYPRPIEYRFAGTQRVRIANNLTDGAIQARDGAIATRSQNITTATAAMFVNLAGADLHLASSATTAIDQGDPTTPVADDWDGESRPAGAAIDIGADERASGASSRPAIVLTSPIAAAVYAAPASLTLAADASDRDGTVASVRFYVDGVLLSTDTSAPYAVAWTGVPSGRYQLHARATDDDGMTGDSAMIAIEVGLPELRETSLANPPVVAVPGAKFTTSDTVSNSGPVLAAASSVRFYLSLDALRNTGDVLLAGTRAVDVLEANATSPGTQTVTIPATTKPGTYRLLGCADDLRRVPESDETNNCRAAAASILVAYPNLRISAISNPPASVAPGQSFTVTETTRNAGDGPAAASLTRFYFSSDATRDTLDALVTGGRSIPTLAPAASVTGSRAVTVPVGMPAGTYFLIGCADDLRRVKESSETDNCRPSATQVRVGPASTSSNDGR
jgi:hypothetical protein